MSDEGQSAKIIEAAGPVLETGIEALRQGQPGDKSRHGGQAENRRDQFPVLCVLRQSKAVFVTAACIGCGKYERGCVLNNVHLKDGKPVWGDRCTHCMACICGCPTEAIEYGRASRGKLRYQCAEYKE